MSWRVSGFLSQAVGTPVVGDLDGVERQYFVDVQEQQTQSASSLSAAR